MVGEKPVNHTDVIREKKSKTNAEEAGRYDQISVDPRKPPRPINGRDRNGSCDQRHAGDGSDPKDHEIGHSPYWIPDCGKNQQRNGGRPRQSMHNSHHDGTQCLVQAQPTKESIELASQGMIFFRSFP